MAWYFKKIVKTNAIVNPKESKHKDEIEEKKVIKRSRKTKN